MSSAGLENAKALVGSYKQGRIGQMNGELWAAKKVVDSTLHPGEFSCCGGKEGWEGEGWIRSSMKPGRELR